jgi:hypothetical protein
MGDEKDYTGGLKSLVKPIMPWRDFLYNSTAIFMLLLRMRFKYQKTHNTLVSGRKRSSAYAKEFKTMQDDWSELQAYMSVKFADIFKDFFFSFQLGNADEATTHLLKELGMLNDEVNARTDEYAERIYALADGASPR